MAKKESCARPFESVTWGKRELGRQSVKAASEGRAGWKCQSANFDRDRNKSGERETHSWGGIKCRKE